jgi:dolichol-phosphate mannosyltransferase
MNKILIFTATYNEVDNIKIFLEKFLETNLIADVLIIDDNSPDRTWEVVEHYQKTNKNFKLIKRENKEGLDTAHKLAFKYAIENNYDYLITMDADLSHDPAKIVNFIKELDESPFVIGSRYIKNGRNETKLSRYLLSYLGNKFIKLILNINCDEFTTSYRGFNLKKLQNFSINNIKSKGYSFFMETVYRIHLHGYKIKEIPIIFKDRKKGFSKIPRVETLRTLKNLFLLKINKI